MKSIVWFCYSSVTPEGKLKAAPWIIAAAEKLLSSGHNLVLISPGKEQARKRTDCGCVVHTVPAEMKKNRKISEKMIQAVHAILIRLRPDVFQIFGTEFSNYLAAGLAAQKAGMLDKTIVWVQGICKEIGECYCDGLPKREIHRLTFRDFLRLDNVYLQKQKFLQRAKNEAQLLNLARHAVGRTAWDRVCVENIAPGIIYHHCSEMLRPVFYTNTWHRQRCVSYRLFMCQSDYPIKGLHVLLRALPKIIEQYPQTVLYISGENLLEQRGVRSVLAKQSYAVYLQKLIRKQNLQNHIVFTGYLTEEEMVDQYCSAHVYILPSMVENSPNSLGEAMILGMPCVAASTGGIPSMLENGREGILYDKTDAAALADAVITMFSDDTLAAQLGQNAHSRACVTHDPRLAMDTLLRIYDEIGGTSHVSQ